MDIKNDRQSIIILKAIESLDKQIDLSQKNDFEKETLKLLIDKIKLYYLKKIQMINENDTYRLYGLYSNMIDYIADINNALLPKAETFGYIEKINSKLFDLNINQKISLQKYINLTKKKLR